MLLDALPIQEKAIGAVQVGDPPGTVDAAQLGVLTRDLGRWEFDIVIGESSDTQTLPL
jgi:hypothetical protein